MDLGLKEQGKVHNRHINTHIHIHTGAPSTPITAPPPGATQSLQSLSWSARAIQMLSPESASTKTKKPYPNQSHSHNQINRQKSSIPISNPPNLDIHIDITYYPLYLPRRDTQNHTLMSIPSIIVSLYNNICILCLSLSPSPLHSSGPYPSAFANFRAPSRLDKAWPRENR